MKPSDGETSKLYLRAKIRKLIAGEKIANFKCIWSKTYHGHIFLISYYNHHHLPLFNCFHFITLLSNEFLTFGRHFKTFVCQTGIPKVTSFWIVQYLERTTEKRIAIVFKINNTSKADVAPWCYSRIGWDGMNHCVG